MTSFSVGQQAPIPFLANASPPTSAKASGLPAQASPAAPTFGLPTQDLASWATPGMGSSLAFMSFFDTDGLHAAWDTTHDQLSGEISRVDKIPGFKADINVGRLKGMVDAIETCTTSDQCVEKLAGELKKAGYASHVGDQPSEASVKAGIKAYLNDIQHDFHLKPR